jgi:hypothetical protein
MYSGHLMDELMHMVAQAEAHAKELRAEQAEPETYIQFASRFIYDGVTQPALAGAA